MIDAEDYEMIATTKEPKSVHEFFAHLYLNSRMQALDLRALIHWLTGCLAGWFAGLLTGCLVCWLALRTYSHKTGYC